jgi:uncharacterized repeat protein (TIGR03803 family)
MKSVLQFVISEVLLLGVVSAVTVGAFAQGQVSRSTPPVNQPDEPHVARRPLRGMSGNLSEWFQDGALPQGSSAASEIQPSLRKRSRRLNANSQSLTGAEQVLYQFQDESNGGADGDGPTGNLIFDSSGNLYGTTNFGGTGCPGIPGGCGTVFELSPSGSGRWTEAVLYRFQGSTDGSNPNSGVIFGQKGNLYGTTMGGGAYSGGTAFELSPAGGGNWTKTILYNFGGSGDVVTQPGGLIFDKAGNLYGAALGGQNVCNGKYLTPCGSIFELSPNGSGGWTETVLYNFQDSTTDGWSPNSPLIFDQAGNLFGTTSLGGNGGCFFFGFNWGCGAVFELSPNGSGGWTETVIYSFQQNTTDGQTPEAGVISDQAGNVYGTTSQGGDSADGTCYTGDQDGCGIVFELSTNGGGTWTETILYAFQPSNDGEYPWAGLIFDQAGNLYGTTVGGGNNSVCSLSDRGGCGTVFELSPNGSGGWTENLLYKFQGVTAGDGSNPQWGVILDHTGNFYGSTGGGGNYCNSGCGIVFEVSRAPFVTFSPTSVNFGSESVGATSSPQAVTLTNSGNLPLSIASIEITGPDASDFAQSNNCPASLPANNTCKISVTFTPAVPGNASASISVTDNASGRPQTVPLTGTGVIPVTLSPSNVTFPSQFVGTSGLPQNVMLKNTGNATLTITNVAASPADFAALSSCGNSVAPGAICSIGVFFDPTASGTRNGILTVTDSASDSPQTVPLTGMGQDFSLAPSSPSSATVMPGQTANYMVTVAPDGGFNQTVTLSCSGAPAMSTCSLSPGSVTLTGSTSAPVTVAVTTAGSSAGLAYPSVFPPARSRLALWLSLSSLSGLVVLGSSGRRSHKGRRRLLYGLAILCVLSLGVTWSACGGGNSGNSSSGTPPGTYNVTVTGTFASGPTNLTRNTRLTLIVQ